MSLVPLRKAVERTGLHPNTLRKYADEGRIYSIINAANQRLFDVDSFIRDLIPQTDYQICYNGGTIVVQGQTVHCPETVRKA